MSYDGIIIRQTSSCFCLSPDEDVIHLFCLHTETFWSDFFIFNLISFCRFSMFSLDCLATRKRKSNLICVFC